MYTYKYPHPAVTADCLVFAHTENGLELLLIQRRNEPCKGKWAFPGGFMNIDETTADAARRELEEETGLIVEDLHRVGVYDAVELSRWPITRYLISLRRSAAWMMLHKQSGSS